MARFRYQSADAAGNPIAGELDAADEAEAREQLRQQGITASQVVGLADSEGSAKSRLPRLGTRDAEAVLGHLAQSAMALAPLAAGLRAAAAETSNRRVSGALRHLATEISRGRAISDVFADSTARMPAHVRGLVAAATRTGRLGPALDDLVEHHRNLRAMFWSIWGSLAYPLFVFAIALVVLAFLMLSIVPQFAVMFSDFGLTLPASTELLLSSSRSLVGLSRDPAKWIVAALLLSLLFAMYLTGTGRGGATIQRMLAMMPILGPLWLWSGASSFMQLLATLLEHDIPLPEALRLAGEGMSNAELRRVGTWLADGVQGGQSLSQLVESAGCLPASAVPVLRWGERAGVVGEAARTLSEMFADRVWARAAWLRTAAPPVIYLFVVLGVGFAVTSLFLPLVSLIVGLS